jgi:hypothetical protein
MGIKLGLLLSQKNVKYSLWKGNLEEIPEPKKHEVTYG